MDLALDAERRDRVALRLSETAVTPCDCSIENATTRLYDGSLPTSVMSVPCSVVTVRDARAAGLGAQNLIGEIRRRRVRHGVVRVHDVELLLARDADDGVGERQQVLRLAEQRIRRRVHALERQSRAARRASGTAPRC